MVTRSIGFKLTLIISLVLLTVFAGKAAYDAVRDYSSAIEKNKASVTDENRLLAAELEHTFAKVHQTCLDLDSLLQCEIRLPAAQRSRERIIECIKMLLEKNSAIRGISTLFEPNAFDGNDAAFAHNGLYEADGRFIPYVVRSKSGFTVRAVHELYSSSNISWYHRPMRERTALMISPYKFEDNIVTTLAIPIIYDGKAIGVINADIDVTSLQNRLEKLPGMASQNFKLLCSGNGTIVANSIDSSKILKNQIETNPEFKAHFEAMTRKETAEHTAVSYTSGLKSKYIFVPVDVPGVVENWAFISVTAISVFIADAKQALISTVIQYIVILFAVVILLYLLIRRYVSKPLQFTSGALKNIAQGEGDLTVRLPVHGKDEIAELSEYFNETITKIGASIQQVGANSSNMEEIGNELASNMTETASSVHQISANIDGVKQQALTQATSVTETATTIEKIVRTIKRLNSSIETQAASVAQSSSSVEQMVANIASIGQTLDKTDALIKSLTTATGDGKATLVTSNAVTQKIAEESGSLMEASSVIQHIASQTNLLAMNAAIEAAHAGEAGKGFAVVADEIRKLAEESSAQGKTITTTLKTLSGEIETLSASSKTVEEKFNTIFTLAAQVKEMSSQLTEAMESQENGSKEVLTAIKRINMVTTEVQAGSEEMLKGGEGVAAEMQKLDGLTRIITESMNEMAASAVQISNAVQEVSEITQRNKTSIDNLASEVGQFKV
ncbi:MAG: methyl-accepting chemotaxis protein [Treponema sp.]